MFGNVINNSLIKELIKQKELSIVPMDEKQLQVAQYPLMPLVIWEVKSENEADRVHDFSHQAGQFMLLPKTYYWVDILEHIKLPFGVIGRFIPSSNLIEKGLGLTAGKIENPFGDKNEKVRFGIYNYLDSPVSLKSKDRIAYIQFIDMRGMDIHRYELNQYDSLIYSRRLVKIQDDGPIYHED